MKWKDYKEWKDQPQEPTTYLEGVECPNCGANIHKRNDIVLTSNPPQYIYFCPCCDWADTARG